MLTITSQVDQVTVHRHGARVTRLAEITQPETGWPRQLRLTNLPLTLLDASVSARLQFPQGGGGFVARELRVELEPVETAPAGTKDDEGDRMKHELTVLQCRLDRLDRDIDKMKKLQPGTLVVSDGQAPGRFPLQARRAVVELRQKSLARWIPQRQHLHRQLDELQQRLNGWMACSQPRPMELTKSVIVSLRGKAEAQAPHIRLLFTYQIEGACWVPGYSLRFDRDYSLSQLDLRALVCQSSGEDWNDVRLSVSTADPASWTELPVLQSQRLGRHQTLTIPGWRPPPSNSEALLADYDGTGPRPRPAVTPRFVPPPAHLSDLQIVAVALMSLPPEVSASLFKELSPDEVHRVTLEISKLPAISPPEREAVVEYFLDLGADLHGRQLDGIVPQFRQLLDSARPASQQRPSQQRATVASAACFSPSAGSASTDISDLLTDKCRVSNTLESLVSSKAASAGRILGSRPEPSRRELPKGNCRWELSLDQLAFDLLYLPGADEAGRGRLQSQSAVQASLKRWKDPTSAREAGKILERASNAGRQAARCQAPAGYRKPEAVKSQDWLYRGEARVTLASDAQFHSVPLLRRQLPSALHWLVVPKVTCDVFRRVELECPPDLALPAGPVDLFVGPDYLACVELPPVAAGESFPLDLGVETGVRVVRNATFKEQTAGMMGGTLQLRHDISIEAANHLGRPVRLQVREPLPQVGEGGECKVRMESQWEALPEEEGQFCWLAVPAGERSSCTFSYFIEMSTKLELVGGNRREK